MGTIRIPLKKGRLRRVFYMALFMFFLSLSFLIFPKNFTSSVIQSSTPVIIMGIIGIVFFGIALLYSGRKVANKNLGLFIDDEGVEDNTSAFRFGKIAWEDISEFQKQTISKQEVICIKTDDPQKYLERIDSPVFKKAAERNLSGFGTPLFINTKMLDIDKTELENLLIKEFEKRKGK